MFAFSCLEDILEAVELIDADYERQSAAAAMIAHDYFDSDRVLTRLLHQVGLPRVPPGLVIAPRSRRPLTLPAETVETVLSTPPAVSLNVATEPATSVVVVTRDGLMFTKLCLESVLGNLDGPALELIVVDNGSTDGTVDYLDHLAKRDQRVRFVAKDWNMGFAAAANLGLGQARGQCFVLLNNDTIVPPSCLARLTKYLEPGDIGGVGPVTNRIGNEAQVDAPYQTYQGLLDFAGSRERDYHDRTFSIRTLAMFCLAMRRITWEKVGSLDERFGIGLLEDDDYSERIRRAGLRLLCAEDVFVHHFGEASFGAMVSTGEYGALLGANQKLFEDNARRVYSRLPSRPGAVR